MNSKDFFSTQQYADEHHISRMQVIRDIKAGKIVAQRLGKVWMIPKDQGEIMKSGFLKTSSLQKWNKIIENHLHISMHIEESKDREVIYSKLNGLGLPHERCLAFHIGDFPTRHEFTVAVERLTLPYWISAVPDIERPDLNRLSNLGLDSIDAGWDFINSIPEKESYKIIVSQYPRDVEYKGTVLVSQSGHGIAEFITGDRHYIMTRGFTLTDPMLFDQKEIHHFSKTIAKDQQKKLYSLLRGIYGHLELQYGEIEDKKLITFFDYNEDKAYIQINDIWEDLVTFFEKKRSKNKEIIYGLPASLGKAKGRCVVIHHESVNSFDLVEKGDIIISDTTTPDMTTLMGKASAIVTDLGGVTSHAAIVCRELKIPAIVGTENATEILRTGDRVEVNADKGEIKILSH